MAKYYFFQTCIEKNQPHLRPLEGQVLDGKPVDTSLNVGAPKEAEKYSGGTRFEYPVGTFFASDFLKEVVLESGSRYYSVFDDNGNCNFHPVSADPDFQFLDNRHIDAKMNAAFALFQGGVVTDDEPATQPTTNQSAHPYPCDENGKAFPFNSFAGGGNEYPYQPEAEMELFAEWIRRVFANAKVRPACKIYMNNVDETFKKLYSAGETLDTLCNEKRLKEVLNDQALTMKDFESLNKSPHQVYLTALYKEHEERKDSSARRRDAEDKAELSEAAEIICKCINTANGQSSVAKTGTALNALKTAMKEGWSVDSLVRPDIYGQGDNYSEVLSKCAEGRIVLPEAYKKSKRGSYIDSLMSRPEYAFPKDSEGFHVEEAQWRLLVRNVNRHENTMIVGPSGTGKTELVRLLCERTGRDLTIIQMGAVTDPGADLIGKMDINEEGKTYFDWAEFALAVQKPGVVLLDEINRVPRNGTNILFGVLDGTRMLKASGAKETESRTIYVHPDCTFVATANVGAEYVGTTEIDGAIQTRFRVPLEMNYLPVNVEANILSVRTGIEKEDATNIAFVADRIRSLHKDNQVQVAVSMRETLACAELVADGFDTKEAMEIVFLPRFQQEAEGVDERAQVRSIISTRFHNQNNEGRNSTLPGRTRLHN